jgi:hypothetical protein
MDRVIEGCIHKFPNWLPGARTANRTALCDYMQLYRYFVSQSSEVCHHNHLCCFSTSVYCCCCCCCCCLFRYRLSPETFGYTLIRYLTTPFQLKNVYKFDFHERSFIYCSPLRYSPNGTQETLKKNQLRHRVLRSGVEPSISRINTGVLLLLFLFHSILNNLYIW